MHIMPAPKVAPGAPHTDTELSEFLLRACHDLRGSLRTVRIHADLSTRKRAAGELDESDRSLGFVASGATTADAVLDGIGDYALALAIDSSRFQPAPLDVLLRAAIAKLAARIGESSAEVVYGDLPDVRGDSDRLLQLFEYLLDDALRRRGLERPLIRISAEREDGAWLFTVSDNGMPLGEALDSAFKPFARIHANRRPGPGLAICRAIVERHGGSMWAESCADGCIFRFTLPEE